MAWVGAVMVWGSYNAAGISGPEIKLETIEIKVSQFIPPLS
jgi:hypothetical protein